MGKTNKTIMLSGLILAILINTNWLHLNILGLILGLVYFLAFGFLFGRLIFLKFNLVWQFLIGIFALFSVYSLIGALVYYFYKLDQLTVSLLFFLISGIIFYFDYKYSPKTNFKLKYPKIKISNLILIITYLILFILSLAILWQNQTILPLSSVWQAIPYHFFIIYFLATINLVLLVLFNKNYLSNILITFHFFLTTSIALIVFKLGYGFDPFIHQATEKVIWQQGFILPKPLYYLGQYSLVIFLSHIWQASVVIIDKLLLPILLTIFLPYSIYKSLSLTFDWQKNISRLLSLIFLFLPFGLFIVTNPQALAGVYTIMLLFTTLIYLKNKKISLYFLALICLTTIFIHPLAGLPALIFLIITWLFQAKIKFKKILLIIISLASAIILPLALYLNSLFSIYEVNWQYNPVSLLPKTNLFSQQFNLFFDLAYLYQNHIYWVAVLASVLVIIYLIKNKRFNIFIPGLITFVILSINAFLLKFINLSQIIDNEQTEFAKRVLILTFYFLLPCLIHAFYLLLKKSAKTSPTAYFLIILIAGLLTAATYISYPRFDDYDNTKYINFSFLDQQTVLFIDQDAQDEPYIVLSNQMTSVAALQEYGFDRLQNNYYFYPIPTGGDLYQYFIQMYQTKTSKETMIKAMELTNVNLAYFVIPTYWKRADIIIQQAKKEADQTFNIANQYFIFKFIKK